MTVIDSDTQAPAGRRLDTEIAFRVMDWNADPRYLAYKADRESYSDYLHPCMAQAPVHAWKDYRGDFILPFYSTRIEDAWQVAEKLRLEVGPWQETAYIASNRHDWNDPDWVFAIAETAPRAICLCALYVVRKGNNPAA